MNLLDSILFDVCGDACGVLLPNDLATQGGLLEGWLLLPLKLKPIFPTVCVALFISLDCSIKFSGTQCIRRPSYDVGLELQTTIFSFLILSQC